MDIDILNALVLLANFVIVPAVSYGSQLALATLSLTIIYGVLRFSNFAQADWMSFGTMTTILKYLEFLRLLCLGHLNMSLKTCLTMKSFVLCLAR